MFRHGYLFEPVRLRVRSVCEVRVFEVVLGWMTSAGLPRHDQLVARLFVVILAHPGRLHLTFELLGHRGGQRRGRLEALRGKLLQFSRCVSRRLQEQLLHWVELRNRDGVQLRGRRA